MSASPNGSENTAPSPAKSGAAAKPGRQLSSRRKWLYRLAAVTLVPALLAVFLEFTLRIVGYGESTDFFLDGAKVEGADVWVENPDFGRWVFPRGLEPWPQAVPFALPKEKKTGTFRVFVIGESAALGFPDASASFARVLEMLLRAAYPETQFEVVNTAMVAINSHIARAIAMQCLQRQPDLLVVHLGNNEVVGPFGAAGVLGPFSPNLRLIRTNLALKTTRCGQLMDRTVKSFARGSDAAQTWKGMAMFADTQIRADDERLTRIYAHHRQNLEDICTAAAAAGVPVALCTIPVNLRDCAPFRSLHAPSLTEEQIKDWEQRFGAGVRLESEKKFADAIISYEEAGKVDSSYAELAYRLGRCYAQLGDQAQAKRQFVRARDLDALRFRSDSTINQNIRDVAAVNGGVRLADAENVFAQASPGEIPGDELFLEHVHMTFHGNYLLGKTVFATIVSAAPPTLRPAARGPGVVLSEQECGERLAHTEWSELRFGAKVYEQLLQEPPFTFQIDHAEQYARWKQKMAAVGQRLRAGGLEKCVELSRKAVQAAPSDWMIRNTFGALLMDSGQMAQASEQYRKSVTLLRHNFAAHWMLGNIELTMGTPRAAEEHYRHALEFSPRQIECSIGLAEALERQHRMAEAQEIYDEQVRRNPSSAYALTAMGRYLHRMGKIEEAKTWFTDALQKQPNIAAIRVELAMIAMEQNKVDDVIEHLEAAQRLDPDSQDVGQFLADAYKRRDANKSNKPK